MKAFPQTVRQVIKLVKYDEHYESVPTDRQANKGISKIS